jgi:predicted nucleic acid-binding protein
MSGSRLFDASSLVDILLGDVDIGVVFDEVVLDLTMYETANALWKIGLAHDQLTDAELNDAVSILSRLEQEIILKNATKRELENTMRVARQNGLTFYHASYLATAKRESLTLVTEDGALRAVALEHGIDVDSVDS